MMRGKTSERLGHGGAVLLLLNQSTPRAPQIPKLSDQISRVRLVGGVGRRDREGEARGSRQISGLDEAINSRSIQSPEWQRFGGPVSSTGSERASKQEGQAKEGSGAYDGGRRSGCFFSGGRGRGRRFLQRLALHHHWRRLQISGPLPALPISSCCLVETWSSGNMKGEEVGGLLGVTPLRSGQPASSSKLPFPCSARSCAQPTALTAERERGEAEKLPLLPSVSQPHRVLFANLRLP